MVQGQQDSPFNDMTYLFTCYDRYRYTEGDKHNVFMIRFNSLRKLDLPAHNTHLHTDLHRNKNLFYVEQKTNVIYQFLFRDLNKSHTCMPY